MPQLADRANAFPPFHAVALFKETLALAAAGKRIINMGIGEPDFTAPPSVVDALQHAARSGLSAYSAPAGIPPLRQAIARYYDEHFGTRIDPARVIVTSGGSGALTLACAVLVDSGAEVLLPDPCYPANCNFIVAANGRPTLVPTTAASRYQLTAQDIREHWGPDTRGVLIASPSNPTGTTIAPDALAELLAEVRARKGFVIMDEIYLGLTYEGQAKSALTLDDDIIVINSFSKYFNMTGWRLGWMIVPQDMVGLIERVGASLAICAPTLGQHAALACFEPEAMAIYEQRRAAFRQRRDYLVPALGKLGLEAPVKPDGAFYVYADIGRLGEDSVSFSYRLLREGGVSALPGVDYGPAPHGRHTMRFSYCVGLDQLEEAVHRIGKLL
ncbi:MAG TPA: pyridoxal phosphate-dependent aminotransferase [Bordetella sp.]